MTVPTRQMRARLALVRPSKPGPKPEPTFEELVLRARTDPRIRSRLRQIEREVRGRVPIPER